MKNPSNALYSVAAIRRIEQSAANSLPPGTLMQRAGQAAAQLALSLLPSDTTARNILVLAGPGNNGGDAFVAASALAERGAAVTIFFDADPGKLPADAKEAHAQAAGRAIPIEGFTSIETILSKKWHVVIDGLFGIGLSKAIAQPYSGLIEAINRMGCQVLALDVPSGLDADTGMIAGTNAGEAGASVRATHTITFIADKPGLHTGHGRDLAGSVHVEVLDIDSRFFETPDIFMNEPALFSHALKPRAHASHKGSYGQAAIVGGAQGMQGAAVLAGRAALHLGAGKVVVGFLDDAPAYDSMQPELMCRRADGLQLDNAAVVAGPGMGTSQQALHRLEEICTQPGPLVMDADALNLLAAHPVFQRRLLQRKGETILTPHPLEAARLLSDSAAGVQANRLRAARELAQRFNAVVVLKGSGTVIARADGKIAINGTGNPALATGGTGDVLAGMCGALLAQACPAWEAALAAVWMHGLAADRLVDQGCGPAGLAAGELIPAARDVLNRLIAGTLDA